MLFFTLYTGELKRPAGPESFCRAQFQIRLSNLLLSSESKGIDVSFAVYFLNLKKTIHIDLVKFSSKQSEFIFQKYSV